MPVNIDNRLFFGNGWINPLNQNRLRDSLGKNTTLHHITLLESYLTDEIVDDLCAFIQQNGTLHSLHFLQAQFTNAGMCKVLRSLCTNTTLKHLDLSRCQVSDAIIDDLTIALTMNNTLETLQFQQADFSDSGLSKILRSITMNQHIFSLAFWESHLTDCAVSSICTFLEENHVMKELQFFKTKLTDSGLSALFQCLSTNSTLEHLVFMNSPLSDAVVPAMCNFIERNNVVKGVRFEEAKFSDSGLSVMLHTLCLNSTLEIVNFAESSLSDDVVPDMCYLIANNQILTRLTFNEARFTDPGLSTLLYALSSNVALEKLEFDQSQLSDAVVFPLCRFLNENNVMKQIVFNEAKFTDAGLSTLLGSYNQNCTLESIVFPKSRLTDVIIGRLSMFSKRDTVLKHLIFHDACFSDYGLSKLLLCLNQNTTLGTIEFNNNAFGDAELLALAQYLMTTHVLTSMIVDQPLDIDTLIKFLTQRSFMTELSSLSRGKTLCIVVKDKWPGESDLPHLYYIRTVSNQTKILPRSEFLQLELMDLLKEHSVPSAVDILNNLLVLFVQKDKEDRFKEALSERLQDVHEDIATAHRIHTLHKAPEFVLQSGKPQWKTGLSVYAPEIGERGLFSTVGAILVDDEGKLYLTSSFHGQKFEKCQILDKYEGECVAEVFKKSPLLDACLIEVIEGKKLHSPTLPAPHVEATLCGPYTGPNSNLARTQKPPRGQPHTRATATAVNKYGIATYLTEGKLLYYNYTDPVLDISEALLVLPIDDIRFTMAGDCGAVIFRHVACADTHTDTVFCHEAIALNCAGMKLSSQNISVACRLDDVIGHFESKLDKKLKLVGTQTDTLEEFLFRMKLH